MNRSGHWGLALLCYSPVVFWALSTDIASLPLVVAGGVLTSSLCMLPDADQWLPIVSHRGATHTVWFMLLVGGLLGGGAFMLIQGAGQTVLGEWIDSQMLFGQPIAVAVGWFFAMTGALVILSHLLGDWITKMGIRPWAPLWGHKHRLGLIYADNTIANGLFNALGALAIVVSFVLGVDLLQYV